ncbi:eukaryotic translation initiation factor 4E-binding protein 1-like [Anneissia japonica]|uniref:eukaryotic translation initiation factor 4E-binding protein 1-like n=1 Tax=Anneissia japonica TaxID=1529436 RepID=UPI0014258000|nr:eukaryotic translation initiation factor 4E-binding protein 1-like [Anneissia japonica]
MSTANSITGRRDIPKTRTVRLNDPSEMPNDYGTTPGGTLFATTPGGTRIIYERNFLMQMRNSPLAQTPPKNLPLIEGVTTTGNTEDGCKQKSSKPQPPKEVVSNDEPQFEMDI